MTVLEKQTPTGVDLSRIGRALLAAMLTAAIAAGVLMAVNPRAVSVAADGQTSSQFLIDTDSPTHQGRTTGVAVTPAHPSRGVVLEGDVAAPFLTGTGSATHTGRSNP